jgi:hypothetical protein
MKKWIFIPIFLILSTCKGEEVETYFTPEKALFYFKSIENNCNLDNGRLWGKNLYGPLMFVDRSTRRLIANQPDNEGLLKAKDGVYTGYYPRELIISNTPVTFGGKLFALTPLPTEEDSYWINAHAIHSLFHRLQKTEGIGISGYNTSNMDDKEARLWIKLEWKALRNALNFEGEERRIAIRDALIFRGANREFYKNYVNDENKFENYEGLATFTYTLMTNHSCEEFHARLMENLDRVYSMQSYARSYGFIHGALYAALLNEKDFNFHMIKTNNFDLGEAVKQLYEIELPPICRDVAGSLAVNYNIDAITREEEKRLSEINERVNKQIGTFTDKPVVFLELESPYFDFEPEKVHSFDTLGTLYSSIRISDNWGKLGVSKGGCLVSNNYKYLRITAKGFKEEKNHISGEGWDLYLNDGWVLVKADQNYLIRKVMP